MQCKPVRAMVALGLLIALLHTGGAEPAIADASPPQHSNPWQAFGMTMAAGSSTGIGALLVCCVTKMNHKVLAMTMAFSAGVMIYVSLVEVIQVSFEKFHKEHSAEYAYLLATVSFFAGGVLMAVTDDIVHMMFDVIIADRRRKKRRYDGRAERVRQLERGPVAADDLADDEDDSADSADEDDEALAIESVFVGPKAEERQTLLLTSALIGIAIALHNVPEGIATYIASFHSLPAGAPLTVAIAVHNIPEGLAVAMPVLHGTGSRSTAVFWAALSGMAEPLGALIAYFFVNPRSSESSFGAMFAISAGMMVYVCLSELLPAAYRDHPSAKVVTQSFFAGCFVMASSLVLERLGGI